MKGPIQLVCALLVAGMAAQVGPNKKPEPTSFAPIAFFNKKCTYCHGRDGVSYPDDLGTRYDEARLYDRLVEMTDEKAHAPVTNKELDVLASWFRALMKKEPYVAWVSSKDGVLTFEATTGAKLTTNSGAAKFEKGVWLVSSTSPAETVTVTATLDKKSTVLRLADRAVSHAKPVIKQSIR